jgi:hypothetical protein
LSLFCSSLDGAQVLFVPGPDGQSIQLQVLTTADGKLIAQQVVPPPACVSNSGPSVAPPPPPPPATPLPHAVFLRALFSFDAQTADDLPFRKGDRMLLTKPPHGDWWYARHLETQQDGYIPSNYVVIDDGKVQSQECASRSCSIPYSYLCSGSGSGPTRGGSNRINVKLQK